LDDKFCVDQTIPSTALLYTKNGRAATGRIAVSRKSISNAQFLNSGIRAGAHIVRLRKSHAVKFDFPAAADALYDKMRRREL
jgi:hypothetical protein